VDSTHASNGTDPVRRPGLALAGGQAHSIERRGDMFVRPAAGHAAYDRQSVFRRCATMFTCSWLPDAQLGMLAAAPMDCEHDIARIIIDIDDNLGDQCPQHLLTRTHRNTRRVPRRR